MFFEIRDASEGLFEFLLGLIAFSRASGEFSKFCFQRGSFLLFEFQKAMKFIKEKRVFELAFGKVVEEGVGIKVEDLSLKEFLDEFAMGARHEGGNLFRLLIKVLFSEFKAGLYDGIADHGENAFDIRVE